MKRVAITGLYTTIGYRFNLSYKLKELLGRLIEDNLLAKYPLAEVKSEILELWIDTAPEIAEVQVNKMSKTGKGKYLSFTLVMPYDKIMQKEENWLSVFIEEFFKGLWQIVTPYQVPEDEVVMLCEKIKQEVLGKEEYLQQPTKDNEFIKQLIAKNKIEKV